MRTMLAAAAALLLLGLAWVPLRLMNTDAATFDRTLAAIDRVSMVENELNRDALSARAGMLRNYDPLVREEAELVELIRDLKETSANPDQAAAIDRLATVIDQQFALVERFKSNNALLQNSLASFQLFNSRLGTSADSATVSAIMALDSAMLQLTLDTSPATARTVAQRLGQLAAVSPPHGQADARFDVLTHGGMLLSLLPTTDEVLKALYAVPVKSEQDKIRKIVLAHQAVSRLWAERLRTLLYATSLVLLGFLIHLARGLRARTRALRERAAFDHVVASVSMRFLNELPHEIDAGIEQSLAELAASFGSGRAYFLQVGKVNRTHTWRSEGKILSADWLDRIPALFTAMDTAETGILHIPRPTRLLPGEHRDALVAAGLSGWLCIASTDGHGMSRFLGFDALGPCRITENRDLSFARPALDVLSNAAERQALEQERVRLATRLQHAHRLETVGALASGIAHNFNNLIGAILGYSEMAESEAPAGGRIARNLSEIRNAGDRARDLVDQILAFGRPSHKPRTEIAAGALIAETVSLLRATLPHQIELIVRKVPDGAVVSGEFASLQQVLLNLCNNAAQAMAGGGQIEITTALHEVPDTLSLNHGELAAGRYVRVGVSDTGRGMSEEVVKRIFEPFYTTRQAGTGLGLATVKEIMLEHNGAIEVHSTPGNGSRFEAWLPCVTPVSTRPETHPTVKSRDRLVTVLLIDEDRARLHRDEEILAAIGYEPVGFTQAADALAACRKAPERFDALIVGPVASTVAPLEFAVILRQTVPGRPILLATITDDMTASALAAAGISEVLGRPLDPVAIAGALQRCLGPSGSPIETGRRTIAKVAEFDR